MTDALWILLTLQIAMGAFDTLYHHELTERLAWRPSQRDELRLHGVRNLIYGVLFLLLGWAEPRGWAAVLLVAVLLVELGITLFDFVEEDRTRRLPASERITHTLLALNYGAILALLLPRLVDWTAEPTALISASHGLWTAMATTAAFGVALFGLRDLAAAGRSERLAPTAAPSLAAGLGRRRHVLITGATGFIGRRLTAALTGAGHGVTALVRNPGRANLPAPIRLITHLDQISDDTRIDAIINLAGEPISDSPWTGTKRRRILRSRLTMTRDVVRLAGRLQARPEILISGSAIGWYGLQGDAPLSEEGPGEPCFSRRLCVAWEKAAEPARELGIRVVTLRTGLVLGSQGGMLSRLLTPFEFGLGGPIGSGRQWMSWIALDDLVRLIVHAVATPDLNGPVNAVAPTPVTNLAFAQALGRALGRPAFMAAPAWPLRAALGDFAEELLLGGQRVVPTRAVQSGFRFEHTEIGSTLAEIVGAHPDRPPLAQRR